MLVVTVAVEDLLDFVELLLGERPTLERMAVLFDLGDGVDAVGAPAVSADRAFSHVLLQHITDFREEQAGGWGTHDAVMRTIHTAGRTVLFSAATVAVSLAAMLIFPLAFLRSFGYAGIAVVALAALGAVIALPALLAILGPRVERLRVRRVRVGTESQGTWHRIAMTVMRRPIPIATVVIVLLVVLGSPFLG